jgi:serine/threonine-protein kinase
MDPPGSGVGRPLVGDVIAGRYRIENVAGEGGMGIVYEAEHLILRQRVALKVLRPGAMSSPAAIERFSVEAAAIARIKSEHVVRVMDAGSLPNGAPYLVMELLEGCDLEKLRAQRGPLPPTEVVDYALQALEALAHAHAALAVHRDLKPANLFLTRVGEGREIIKLLDFGIAMTLDVSDEEESDRIFGSPVYMSPEQLKKETLDGRSDLWSLGVVMYELLAGAPPFTGTTSEVINAILMGEPVPVSQRVRTISPELARIIGTCLARDRAKRWASAAELARALAPHGSGAWKGLLERIERTFSHAAPVVLPRRFATVDTALQALDSEASNAPVQAHGATIPVPPSKDPPSSGRTRLRVLLLDDSPIALGMHRHVLLQAGFDVRATLSVDEFDTLIESWKPHLVLMDVQMPGSVSGDDLCKRVKEKFRASVPVVLLSAMRREQLEDRAKRGGADAWFEKTDDLDSFVGFVKNICAMTYSPEDLPDALVDDS